MKKMYKTQKGITLVALVITIIVLVILAAVSINAVMNDGLIKNAETAVGKYEAAKEKEETELGNLLQKIENAKGKVKWEQEGNKITGTLPNGDEKEFTVGNKVTYTSAGQDEYPVTEEESGVSGALQTIRRPEQITWYVLGVDEGRLQLLGDTTSSVVFDGTTGFTNYVSVINSMFDAFYGNHSVETVAAGFSTDESYWRPWSLETSSLPTSFYSCDLDLEYLNSGLLQVMYFTQQESDSGLVYEGLGYPLSYDGEKINSLSSECLPIVTLGPSVVPVVLAE